MFLQGKPNPVVGAGIVVKQAPTDLRVCKGIPITLIVSSDGSRGNRSEGTEPPLPPRRGQEVGLLAGLTAPREPL